MFSHQYENSIGNELYNCYWYKDAHWKLHYHRGYEFVWVTRGELSARVGEKEYTLREGDALFITPYQLHSYTTSELSECYITVFSGSYVGNFSKATAAKEPTDASFRISAPLEAYLSENMIGEKYGALGEKNYLEIDKPSLFTAKACLYAVCAEFFSVSEWREKRERNELVFQIISYVEKHYTENITLRDMSDALSYEYHYVSRVLRESLNMRFCMLVNQYRCERARMLITETGESISAIAMNCGFQSIRTFNRAFYEVTGMTPTDVRNGKRLIKT